MIVHTCIYDLWNLQTIKILRKLNRQYMISSRKDPKELEMDDFFCFFSFLFHSMEGSQRQYIPEWWASQLNALFLRLPGLGYRNRTVATMDICDKVANHVEGHVIDESSLPCGPEDAGHRNIRSKLDLFFSSVCLQCLKIPKYMHFLIVHNLFMLLRNTACNMMAFELCFRSLLQHK